MSWKMFWQIVLLIVIAAMISSALKFGYLCMRKPMMDKHVSPRHMRK